MWKRVGMSQDLTISDAEPGDAPRREGSRSRQTSRVGEKNGPSGTSLLKALRDDHETLLELMTSTPCSSSWQAKQSKAFQKRLEAANSAVSAAADVVRFSSLYYTGLQWLRWHGFRGFLGTHQFLNSGFRNPSILEREN